MCYNCGCELPKDDMGQGHALKDPNGRSITDQTFDVLAAQTKKSAEEVKKLALNQLEGKSNDQVLSDLLMKNAAESQAMTEEEAKVNTKKLLEKVLHQAHA